MLTKKAIYFWLLVFYCTSTASFSQTIDLDRFLHDPQVDSLIKDLSLREKINQIVLIRVNATGIDSMDILDNFGAVLTEFRSPAAHLHFIHEMHRSTKAPLRLSMLSEGRVGIDMDSIAHFGSDLTLSAVSEPHLMYETGKALAEQCKILGIDGLLSHISDFTLSNTSLPDWQMSEINQGLLVQGILPIDFLTVADFKRIELQNFIGQDTVGFIMLSENEISEFQEQVDRATANDPINPANLDKKVRYMLALKLWSLSQGAEMPEKVDYIARLNAPGLKVLEEDLAASSVTVLKNDLNLLPIRSLENKRIASLTIGKSNNDVFKDYLDNYTSVDHYQISYYAGGQAFAELWSELIDYDLVICGLYESDYISSIFIEVQGFVVFQDWLNRSGKAIVAYFGDPEVLAYDNMILNSPTLILSYENNRLQNSLVPQVIFGARGASGNLPVTINELNEKGDGQRITKLGRFAYSLPESAGLDGSRLCAIDSLAAEAIQARAIPGCQILVARNNCVIYKKSFGYHTYDSLRSVTNDDLYDLASITKVSGALPALMKLYEEGKFDLDATMGTYLSYFKRGNKKKLHYREILAHQAGLVSWIPYWTTTIRRNGKYRRKTLNTSASEDYPYMITDSLFVHRDYKKKIFRQIRKSKIGEKKYLYSGLTFYIFPDIIEEITGEDYQKYIRRNFYDPLGASSLTYNPLDRFQMDQIVETEYDSLFRKTQIHGRVHDEGAAMMHGVSSNAGLFANANDLAKLFQMYCNYGTFGGREYLKEETVQEFTRCQFPENHNRRALGFDRPLLKPHENGNTAKSASQLSFGHTGFTGTFAWADPKYNLVYIFLSNRVYPTRENTKLYDMNVRTDIQEVIYQSMFE